MKKIPALLIIILAFINGKSQCSFDANVTATYTTCTNPCGGTAVINFTCSGISFPLKAEVFNSNCSGGGYCFAVTGITSSPIVIDSLCCNTSNYLIIIYDNSNSQIGSSNVNVTCPSGPIITKQVTPASCHDTCDGKIIITATGSYAPFTFDYAPPQPGGTSPTDTISSLCGGTYTITATNSIGCTTTVTASVTNPFSNQFNITSNDTSVCENDTVTIIASGANSYLWNNGSTSDTLIVAADSTQTYSVTATSTNGCTISDSITIFTSVCAGQSSPTVISAEIKIYPSPARETIHIENIEAGTIVRMIDLTGKIIAAKKADSTKTSINIASLPNGIYVLRIENGGRTEFKKVVLSR